MTVVARIDLPPAQAVEGGVLSVARPLPGEWERGTTFGQSEACLTAGTHVFCPTSPTEKEFQGIESYVFSPYAVVVGVECTTLSLRNATDLIDKARRAAQIKAEYTVGVELSTGAATSNPSFADADSVGATSSLVEAVSLLEGAIAANLQGFLAYVHMSPQALVYAAAGDAVYRDLNGWKTPSGHIVVSSPGYVGLSEVVATTELSASVGEPFAVRTENRAQNRHLAVYEAPVLAVFDPCFNVSVELTSPIE